MSSYTVAVAIWPAIRESRLVSSGFIPVPMQSTSWRSCTSLGEVTPNPRSLGRVVYLYKCPDFEATPPKCLISVVGISIVPHGPREEAPLP